MSDTAAAFCDVTSFDGRIPVGDCRRFVRALRSAGDGIIIALGVVGAAGLLIGAVTVAAAWFVNTALTSNPHTRAHIAVGQGTFALGKYGPSLAAAPDAFPPAPVATAEAENPDAKLAFEAKWAGVAPAVPAVPRVKAVAIAPAPEMAPVSEPTPVARLSPKAVPETGTSVPLPRPNPAPREVVQAPVVEPPAQVAMAVPPPAPPPPEKRVTPQQAHNKSMALPNMDGRTAVYDISARTVYMPNGARLEAHSGLGEKMDDPRFIHVRMRGATPPNVYNLTMREKLFHGVRAIRLNPVDEDKMFGRDGMLAHSYMLGPNGQSNGCVSFKDYDKFLQAFLDGQVERLVVVSHLGTTPPALVARTGRVPAGRYASAEQFDRASAQAW